MSVIATVVPPVERNCVDGDDAWVLLLLLFVVVEVGDWLDVEEEVEGGGRVVMDVT